MGRYSILHLLVYHCFDYKEAKESQVESLIDFPPPIKQVHIFLMVSAWTQCTEQQPPG